MLMPRRGSSACCERVHAVVAHRGLVDHGDVPGVEADRPQRERDDRVRETRSRRDRGSAAPAPAAARSGRARSAAPRGRRASGARPCAPRTARRRSRRAARRARTSRHDSPRGSRRRASRAPRAACRAAARIRSGRAPTTRRRRAGSARPGRAGRREARRRRARWQGTARRRRRAADARKDEGRPFRRAPPSVATCRDWSQGPPTTYGRRRGPRPRRRAPRRSVARRYRRAFIGQTILGTRGRLFCRPWRSCHRTRRQPTLNRCGHPFDALSLPFVAMSATLLKRHGRHRRSANVLIGLATLAALLTVPLFGGRLTALGGRTPKGRHGSRSCGLAMQILIINVIPERARPDASRHPRRELLRDRGVRDRQPRRSRSCG